MIKSHFKLAIRNIIKNKVSSFINIFGLSTAIGCSVVAFAFVHFTYTLDSFHDPANTIFMVENTITLDGHKSTWALTPVPLAPALKAEFPQVKYAVRVENEHPVATVRHGDKIFNEDLLFVDEDFLHMFAFPLKYGRKAALRNRNAVVLSEQIALKYFGDENPVGKPLTITYDNTHTETFLVAGVAEPFRPATSFSFNILLPYEKRRDFGFDRFDDWGAFTRSTFVQLIDGAEIETLAAQMHKYVAWQNAAREDWHVESFIFEPLRRAVVDSYDVRGSLFLGAHPAGTISMAVMSLFLLALACFNYVNIAIGSAARRLKEIGIRKVVGSTRLQLVRQFLSENLLLCFIVLVVGFLLAELVFLPAFNTIVSNYGVAIPVNLADNPMMWAFLALLLLLIGIGAGAYPAFYISAFRPVNILRGQQELAGKNLFTRFLLTLQFAFSFITIFMTFAFTRNAEYLRNREWGYKQEQVIVVPIDGETHYEVFRNEIEQHPDIVSVAGSHGHVGGRSNSGMVEIDGKKYDVRRFRIGLQYFETMGLRLKSGRTFQKELSTDASQAIVVNETLARKAGLTDPVGKHLICEGESYTVIGLVEDFHFESFDTRIQPAVLELCRRQEFEFVAVRAKAGAVASVAAYLERTWKQLIPDAPYLGFFQESIFAGFFRQNQARSDLSVFVAGVALVLTCMGLFGLTMLDVTKRMKEFSIRKVLGANMLNISALLNREFFILLGLAFVLAWPLSFVMMDFVLDFRYEYRIELDVSLFVLSAGCLLIMAVLTVSSQLYRVAIADPIDALRSE
ncbi:MAG: ABC transporter permease [bacterium]